MAAEPESCVVCHGNSGVEHQASYDELYQDGVITVSDITYTFSAPNTHRVTFRMTMDGEPVDFKDMESSGIYWVPYTGSAFQFEPPADRLSLKGTLSYSNGVSTSTITSSDAAYSSNLGTRNGLVVIYGMDESAGRLPARIRLALHPFAGLKETGSGVDYVSAANNDGCEKCHTDPYLKHGYIYAQVDNDASNDFYTCKACHLDNGEGGHYEWQLLVNDPVKAVEWLNSDEDTSIFTPEELEMYAYTTSLMNDVHMSHAMEFPYPQSMANCIVCHEDKLDLVLTAENLNIDTCKSCHPMTGSEEYGTADLALETIIPTSIHGSMNWETVDCSGCHEFSDIHVGYNTAIYASEGEKYSDAIVVSIDDASLSGNELSVEFSASGSAGSVDSADIVPEVMIGLYGYDTKDYIVNGHDRYDSSGNGVISRADGDLPKGAYVVGTAHAYFTTVSDEPGSWAVTHDLTEWVGLINDGTVKRIEIAVLSVAENADGEEVAINAVSKTFDIDSNSFDDYFNPIVKVEDGCNNCHDALATTFHAPDYGGSVTVCRMCHVGLVGGSHLEMQSRSIDSYVHAIHAMQPFDIGDINFDDPVEELHYEHHIGFPYPTHGITNCESCHVEGTYNVPDQTKSLPGVLSASDSPLEGWDRDIGEVPSYITGPASRACGSCHRSTLINEDMASELAALNQHAKQNGYLIETSETDVLTVIQEVMAHFE